MLITAPPGRRLNVHILGKACETNQMAYAADPNKAATIMLHFVTIMTTSILGIGGLNVETTPGSITNVRVGCSGWHDCTK